MKRFPWSVLASALSTLLCTAAIAQQPTPAADPSPSGATSVAIVVDTSTTAQKKLPELKEGISTFLSSFGDDDEVCLYAAGGKPQLLEEFTADTSLLAGRLRDVKPDGKLALSDAITAAQQYVRDERAGDRAAVVVFVASPEAAASAQTAAANAEADDSTSVPVHVITAPGSDWRAQESLQRLSTRSGGTAYFPATDEQFREIAATAGRRLAGEDTNAKSGTGEPLPADAKHPLATYDSIVVRDVPVADTKETQEFPGGDNAMIQHLLLARLQKANIFPNVTDGSSLPAPTTASQSGASPSGRAELLATLVKYRRGNRMQRQFIGWKGGALYRLQVVVVDAATRQPLMSFIKEASSAVGPFGGSQELVQSKAMFNVVNQIVKELRKAKRG